MNITRLSSKAYPLGKISLEHTSLVASTTTDNKFQHPQAEGGEDHLRCGRWVLRRFECPSSGPLLLYENHFWALLQTLRF